MTLTTNSHFWQVLLPLPLKDCFDYRIDPALGPELGAYVRVKFAGKDMVGVIWKQGGSGLAEDKIKPIAEILSLPPLPDDLRAFADWAAEYTMNPRGAILKMILSERSVFAVPKRVSKKPPVPMPQYNFTAPELESQQQEAAESFLRKLHGGYSATLLEGVTGSGKTEVYFHAIDEILRAGKQALVLLPEIGLAAQFLRRFEAAFGAPPTVWHSDLTPGERKRNWLAIAKGEAKIIVGARSALFLPYANLGLIVVDEEHESAYKQEEGVLYHARDMAVARAHAQKIPALLVSATPSLESLANVEAGKYTRLHLPERYNRALLPQISLIDLRREKLQSGKWIAPRLAAEIEANLARGEQTLLYLNRRGYAPLTLCRACGHRLQCRQCSAWMVEHARHGTLQCHHCGDTIKKPAQCPECKAANSLHPIGPGVERVEEEARALFPAARIAVMSSDTADHPEKIAGLVQALELGEIDILIGTQMTAKGYHFPRLTLVGAIDADLGLSGGDLRAAERVYQLLLQVAGRSGRESLAGRVFLQTAQPDHPVLQALAEGSAERFVELQMEERKLLHMPPYARLAAVIVSGRDANAVRQHTAQLQKRSPHGVNGIKILGPAPAPLAMLRGKYRERFLVKADKNLRLQEILRAWLSQTPAPRSLRVQVDIDPYSFI